MSTFNIGDSVVVPGCGVGTIEDIEVVDLGEDPCETYRVTVDNADMRLWVPVASAASQGLRPPVSVKVITKLLETIRATKCPPKRATWNRRQRRYTEQLMSNDPIELAKLLGELADAKSNKPLSFGERRMFERATDLLRGELEASENPDELIERLQEALAA